MNAARNRRRLVAGFATIYLVWGSSFLASRIAVQHLPPLQLVGMPIVLGGVLLINWPIRRRAARSRS